MISVADAKNKILSHQNKGQSVVLSLDGVCGLVLAEDILSPLDVPVFDNSAMDGFALISSETRDASIENPIAFSITEDLFAGQVPAKKIQERCCAKIMTGAMIPDGADAVVMQEDVCEKDGQAMVQKRVRTGENIRFHGEEITRGKLVLHQGTPLTPGAISCLASLGMDSCPVHARPVVTIIPTGTELVPPGQELRPGQIYESNSYGLRACLRQMGIEARVDHPVQDTEGDLRLAIHQAVSTSTHVLVSGGVSVGEHDYSKSVFADLHVETIFWKVAQKPGRPFYFGMKDKVSVFGLPGNPASSLVCFYEYIRPALMKFMGFQDRDFIDHDTAILEEALKKKSGRVYFFKGVARKSGEKILVKALQKQESHMMQTFAKANCLIVAPLDAENINEGESVEIHWLPLL